jgi:hypothetical protein
MKKITFLGLLIFVLSVLVSGCGNSSFTPSSFPATFPLTETVVSKSAENTALAGESLYIKIRVAGEINDFEIHDDKGRKFQPYFFQNPKNSVEIRWLQDAKVTDADKRKFFKERLEPLPDTDFNANASEAWVRVGTNETRQIFFPASGWMTIEVVRGKGENSPDSMPHDITFATRYRDVYTVPSGAMVRLTVRLDGTVNLSFDADRDGNFEGTVSPTVVLSGQNAKDISAPELKIEVQYNNSNATITIIATDQETGIDTVFYSLDGESAKGMQFERYSVPFTVPLSAKPVRVTAFANDKAGNRSSPSSKVVKFNQ